MGVWNSRIHGLMVCVSAFSRKTLRVTLRLTWEPTRANNTDRLHLIPTSRDLNPCHVAPSLTVPVPGRPFLLFL